MVIYNIFKSPLNHHEITIKSSFVNESTRVFGFWMGLVLGGWPISSSLPPSGSANRARAQLSWQAPLGLGRAWAGAVVVLRL